MENYSTTNLKTVMTMKLIKIVTHHESPKRAAELFSQEGVVAMGWRVVGDISRKSRGEIKEILRREWKYSERKSANAASQLLKFRDEVDEGDIVFAYKGDNKVALIGEVDSGYKFNDRNKLGNSRGFGYPHQRKVKWWDNPRNFDRSFLPSKLAKWVARIGTISTCEFDLKKLKETLQKVPSQEMVTKALEIKNEDEIKDYMERHLEDVEEGLTLVEREHSTSIGPMDFLAKDKNDNQTVIEVKVKAHEKAVGQTLAYMQAYKEQSNVKDIRGIIVAEEFTLKCKKAAKASDLDLSKCKKKFVFEKL